MNNMRLDFTELENLVRKAKKNYVIQVGILGSDDARDDGLSNATIGMTQEFGSISKNIPARSFLRMPLSTKSKDLYKALNTKAVAKAMEKADFKRIFELVGIRAEAIIQEAFSTSGFGQWAANSIRTIRQKGSNKPLIDTGELRKAIHSRVVVK